MNNKLTIANVEAEKSVLLACILDQTVIDSVNVLLKPDDFYNLLYSFTFKALNNLLSKNINIDATSLVDELEKLGIDCSKYQDDIFQLFTFDLSFESVLYHAGIVKEHSIKRKLYKVLKDLNADLLDNTVSVNTILNRINFIALNSELTYDLNSNVNLEIRAKEIFNEIKSRNKIDDIKNNGLKTGFNSLDKIIVGFKEGNFIIIGARPSIGKTTFALNIAINLSISKYKIGFFSLEMSSDSLIKRSLSYLSGVSHFKIQHDILNRQEEDKIALALRSLKDTCFFINSKPNIDILSLCSEIRRMVKIERIKIIFIDYLSLITCSQKNQPRFEQVAFFSKTLKDLARTLCIPIVALSQLTRDVQDKEPSLASLRESGALEQDADLVILMHRDKSQQKVSNAKETIENLDTKVIISKNRNGSIGETALSFNPSIVSFLDTLS